ncbi:MAG: photosystem chlorophyll a apoprotein [Bacteroidota bacterium]|jgi:outer membrane protein OmpA-like peptidoglycan-associated protein
MKALLTLSALLLTFNIFAQRGLTEEADRLFDKFSYPEALDYYRDAWQQDSTSAHTARQIGLCMRKLGMLEESGAWFMRAIELKSEEPLDMLYYAESMKSNREYAQAVFWYALFGQQVPDDRRAQMHLKDTKYFHNLMADSLRYELKRLSINTDKPSFGMCKFNDRYIFSTAGIRTFGAQVNTWNDLPYLDIYQCDIDDNGEFVDATPVDGSVNSKYHDGPAFYDPVSQTMFVTRNNVKGGRPVYDKSGTANLKVYAHKWVNGGWTKAMDLPFNSEEYSVGHAAMNRAGDQLIFVSNMPGGYGGTDLYRVSYQNGVWGQPENLGPVINTEGNEMFPFISDNNLLYFSSDGQAGLGGLDIFVSEPMSMFFKEPKNLGFPINSPQDDFSIYYNEIEEVGYFSTNRTGKGSDNIYRFSTVKFMQQIVAMTIRTNESAQLAGKYVTLSSLTTQRDTTLRLDETGSFQVLVDAGHEFAVFMGSGETRSSEPITTFKVSDLLEQTYLHLGEILVGKEQLIEAGIIKEVIEKLAVIAGNDSLDFQAKDQEIRMLLEKLRKETNFLSNAEFDQLSTTNLIDDTSLNQLVSEQKEDVKQKNAELREFRLNNIYFGFDQHNVRTSERDKLAALIKMLNEDPTLSVIVKAHTDSRGDDNYNLALSLRRAQAVQKYLNDKGISSDRFQIAWVGERELAVDCVNQPCTAADHGLNRRVEVIFVGTEAPILGMGE